MKAFLQWIEGEIKTVQQQKEMNHNSDFDREYWQGAKETLELVQRKYGEFLKAEIKENQRVKLKTKTIDNQEIVGFINAVWNEGEEGEAKGFPDGMRYYVVTIPIDYSDWRGIDEFEVID